MSEETPYDRVVVSIEDSVKKPGDGDPQYWPSRRVRVELTYYLSEDDESLSEATAKVGDAVDAEVSKRLGLTASTAQPAEVKTRTRRTKEQIKADEAAAAAQTVGNAAGPSDPTDLPQEDARPVSDAPTTGGSSGGGQTASTTAADPTALEDDTPLPQSSSTGPSDASPADDPFIIEPEAPAPAVDTSGQIAPISDGDLNSAVQVKNGALGSQKGTAAIRALIQSYNSDTTKVFQVRDIPADRRAEFINKLNAIKVD